MARGVPNVLSDTRQYAKRPLLHIHSWLTTLSDMKNPSSEMINLGLGLSIT